MFAQYEKLKMISCTERYQTFKSHFRLQFKLHVVFSSTGIVSCHPNFTLCLKLHDNFFFTSFMMLI